jgi:FMN phosphatase YigB (HAD superfamily)
MPGKKIVFFDAEGTLWVTRSNFSTNDYWKDPGLGSARRVFEVDPDASEVLRKLRTHGIRTVVVSRHVAPLLNELLDHFGLRDLFDEVLVVWDKAAAIQQYLGSHGLDASQAAMVGDTLEVDVLPAASIGVSSYLIDRTPGENRQAHEMARLSDVLPVVLDSASE